MKYLRILGFDTLYDVNYSDREIVRITTDEHRIVLTCDRALLTHKSITHGCYVWATKPREQLEEILTRLDFIPLVQNFWPLPALQRKT